MKYWFFYGCLKAYYSCNASCSPDWSGLDGFCVLSVLCFTLPIYQLFVTISELSEILCHPKSFSLCYSPTDTTSWQLPVLRDHLCFHSLTESVIREQWFSFWVDIIFKLAAILFSFYLLLSSYPSIIHTSSFSPVHLPALWGGISWPLAIQKLLV